MLHKKCGFAVVIARARVKGVRHILNRDLGDIILLDDGFQHRWLARDLDILAVNAGSDESIDRFLSGEVLPLGDFRENAQAGMRRAAMLVLSSRREHYVDESVVSRVRAEVPKEMEIFSSKYTPAEAREIGSESVLPKGAVLAFTGIAQPQGFLTTLASMGYEVKEQRCFADHHEFSDTDMQKLRELSQGLPLVCTEKDAVRLESSACNSTGLYYLPITPEIDRAKEFFSFIERSVVKHR
jgi:tetraacyldisaccharide 4'-kinase